MTDKRYLLDGADEVSRLDMQAAFYDPERDVAMMRPAPTDRVLDAGCGSAAYSRAIARTVRRGAVTGVDREAKYIDYATRKAADEGIANATFVPGDVCGLLYQVYNAPGMEWPVARSGSCPAGSRPGQPCPRMAFMLTALSGAAVAERSWHFTAVRRTDVYYDPAIEMGRLPRIAGR